MTHDELVQRAARWLRNSKGCPLVYTEPVSWRISEQPDAIGWRGGGPASIVVECKTSTSDWCRDNRKAFRRVSDLGSLRYYLVPAGLKAPGTLLPYWGILDCHPKQIRVRREARGVPDKAWGAVQEIRLLSRLAENARTELKTVVGRAYRDGAFWAANSMDLDDASWDAALERGVREVVEAACEGDADA